MNPFLFALPLNHVLLISKKNKQSILNQIMKGTNKNVKQNKFNKKI